MGTPPGSTRDSELFARHLRLKYMVRIAVGRTLVPDDWHPHPDDLLKMHPYIGKGGRNKGALDHYHGLMRWRRLLRVGAAQPK